MKNLRAVLEEADPLRGEPALAAADVRNMRRRVLGATEVAPALSFPRTLPVAALVAVMIVAGMAAGRRLSDRAPDRAAAGTETIRILPQGGERRQVQFATPGGTRIIWTIDPNFQMRGVLP